MTYERLREVFENVQRVHDEAAEFCAEAAKTRDQRLGLLADFFRQREKALARRLKSLEDSEDSAVLETWVQYVLGQDLGEILAELRAGRDPDSNAALTKCSELQTAIIGLFRQLAENVNAPSVRAILEDLAASEESALHELGMAKMTQREA